MKEALFVARDGSAIDGRLYWGGYDEFGIDVHLTRPGTGIVLQGTDKLAVRSPSNGAVEGIWREHAGRAQTGRLRSWPRGQSGAHRRKQADRGAVGNRVAAGVAPGMHDVTLRGATAVKAFAVYDHVSYIKVMPDASFARLGGTIVPKQYAQFEAVAFANGPDGKPGTDDDLELGPVTANWSLEEFFSGPNDDDVKFVGKINDAGLFTPSGEGRIPSARNNPTTLAPITTATCGWTPPISQRLGRR